MSSGGRQTAVSGNAQEYLIDGKVYGKTRIVFGFVLLAIVAVIDAVIIKADGFTCFREIKKVVRHRAVGHSGSRVYYFYFAFTDVRGKTQMFQFEKPIH